VRVVEGSGAANGGLGLDLWHVVDLGVSMDAIRELPAGTVVAAEVNDGERVPGARASASEPVGGDPRATARRSIRDRRLPGDGDFDIKGFVATVRATGYDGPWGVELLSQAIGDMGPRELARRVYDATIERIA
jgi:sugar phosphate isomerase/epimerase